MKVLLNTFTCITLMIFIFCFLGCKKTFVATDNTTVPQLTTLSANSQSEITAQSGGNITNGGGLDVTARGVCWKIKHNPTIDDNKTIDGEGIGVFTSSITGLVPNTTYYVRAYATNNLSTSYGNEVTFRTP